MVFREELVDVRRFVEVVRAVLVFFLLPVLPALVFLAVLRAPLFVDPVDEGRLFVVAFLVVVFRVVVLMYLLLTYHFLYQAAEMVTTCAITAIPIKRSTRWGEQNRITRLSNCRSFFDCFFHRICSL